MEGVGEILQGSTFRDQRGPREVMGKDDFLKLFIAQVKHQDPLNPLDAFQFTAQLAQFTQIEQLINLNRAVEDLQWLQGHSVILQAVGFIGKEITSTEDSLWFDGDEATAIHYRLGHEVKDLKAMIYDEGFHLVRVISLGRKGPGEGTIRWDGLNDQGESMPAGRYYFRLEAVDEGGNPTEVSSFIRGRVTGLRVQDGTVCLMLGDLPVPLSTVTSVEETQ